MAESLPNAYQAMVAAGGISHDAAQVAAVAKLSDLEARLEASSVRRAGRLASLFRKEQASLTRGLYLWGGVGRGKSMLMDLFFASVEIERKRRVHFHGFMQEVHTAIHEARKSGARDPIVPVAKAIADQARLLCFDEMQINDITDAMIVGRLFEQLFSHGVTVVVTSNRAPGELYKNGLNRQLFVPFIKLLEDRMDVHHLTSQNDYRQDFLHGRQTYFTPDDAVAKAAIDTLWQELTQGNATPLTLKVKSRDVVLPQFFNGVARASFDDLCAKPLGAGDFLAIADVVRVLVLDNIPQMSRAKNNEAKRFVTLIDTLYEAQTKLICSAAAEPEALYTEGSGAFEFERTASRLREMQGADWGEG